jgi:hypothetical protein
MVAPVPLSSEMRYCKTNVFGLFSKKVKVKRYIFVASAYLFMYHSKLMLHDPGVELSLTV